MSIDFEEPSTEQLVETAAQMPTLYFLGEALQPFSLGRQLASQRVLGGLSRSDLQTSLAIVYLCTLKPSEYERTRVPSEIPPFLSRMEAWAESKGIGLKGNPGKEVVRIADEIWAALDASDFDVKLKPDQRSKDSPSPND